MVAWKTGVAADDGRAGDVVEKRILLERSDTQHPRRIAGEKDPARALARRGRLARETDLGRAPGGHGFGLGLDPRETGSGPVGRRQTVFVYADVAAGNARCEPDKLRVVPRAGVGRIEEARQLGFFVEFKQFDPLRSERRPEKQAAGIGVRIVCRTHPDAFFQISVGILDGVIEPALFPGRPVKADGIGPVIAANIALEIQDAVPTEQALGRSAEERGAFARHRVEIRVLGERRTQPAEVGRGRLTFYFGIGREEEALARHEIFHQRPREPRVDFRAVGDEREAERVQGGDVLHRAGHIGVVGETAQVGIKFGVVAQAKLEHAFEGGVERTKGVVAHIGEAVERPGHALVGGGEVRFGDDEPHHELARLAGLHARTGTTEQRCEEHRLREPTGVAQRHAEARVGEVRQRLERILRRIGEHAGRDPAARDQRGRQRAAIGGLEKRLMRKTTFVVDQRLPEFRSLGRGGLGRADVAKRIPSVRLDRGDEPQARGGAVGRQIELGAHGGGFIRREIPRDLTTVGAAGVRAQGFEFSGFKQVSGAAAAVAAINGRIETVLDVLGRGLRGGGFPAPREHIINRTRVAQLHRGFGKLPPTHFKIRIGTGRQHGHDWGKLGDRAVGHRDFELARRQNGEPCSRAGHRRFSGNGAEGAGTAQKRDQTGQGVHGKRSRSERGWAPRVQVGRLGTGDGFNRRQRRGHCCFFETLQSAGLHSWLRANE